MFRIKTGFRIKTSKEMKRQITILSLILATAMLFTACRKDEMGLVSLNAKISDYAGAGSAKMYVDGSRYTHWMVITLPTHARLTSATPMQKSQV